MLLDIQSLQKVGNPIFTLLTALLQAVALALLFTKEAGDWLLKRPSLEDTFE